MHLIRLIALLGLAGPLQAQDPLTAIRTYRDAHQGALVGELRDFLSLTNVAGNLPNIRRNAEALVAMLEKRGARAQVLETGAEPIVFGEIGDPSKPTILFYCHYDGQPVSPASWHQPDPWQPALRTRAVEAGGTPGNQWAPAAAPGGPPLGAPGPAAGGPGRDGRRPHPRVGPALGLFWPPRDGRRDAHRLWTAPSPPFRALRQLGS